jgi:hypothetical protein
MDELKRLLDKTLADEDVANDDYGKMIEAIGRSDMSDELKVLATVLVEKIRIDEETHYVMLTMLKNVVQNID